MKTLYSRLVIVHVVLLSILLAGLGIVLGQFFHLFDNNADSVVQQQYLVYLTVVLVIAFILSIYMATRLLSLYAKPIDEVTAKAVKIANGNFILRTPVIEPEPHDELSFAINKIALTMQEMSKLRGMEKERLKTLIESMGSGLLMFGRGGTVNLVNGVFRKTFGFQDAKILGETVSTLGLPLEIETLIENVYMTEKSSNIQVHLVVDGVSSSVSVYGAPVIGTNEDWLGIVVVIHDITELVRLEEVRKDFVANVSHELRTPVTSIKGFTETLLDGAMDERAVMKEFLQIIQKESNRLQQLIEELLVLSDVERDGFRLQYDQVDLEKVITDALQLLSGSIARKKMNIVLDLPTEIIIDGDEDRLIQVMVNLLSNAISYSLKEKTIKIRVENDEKDVLIVVQDEGIGIDQAELGRLFERFYRVDRARSRDSGGTGLGLAIVKHLIEAHRGTVEVESKLLVGTTIYIQLPKTSGSVDTRH